MAFTTQLIGTIGGGGGASWAGRFTGKGTVSRTVGREGKNYVLINRGGTFTANGSAVDGGATANSPYDVPSIATGPVTITFTGATTTSAGSIYVTEVDPV
ncbi:hypothetical protein [Corynebacterium doosanense]|uniref:Uncharacterized protein n=1 Tax=Corynebacterium doosanense CAU 212 = DSM 45436 TaxID=558173 RepID=A0A097IJ91_9CORY|nr:hypothetical protein [Corynebacterium doosanense]AIT62189.1 hypothetical protein CDOO_02015 [Corynebacterium doosanense CAU 212 = DSM 45436]